MNKIISLLLTTISASTWSDNTTPEVYHDEERCATALSALNVTTDRTLDTVTQPEPFRLISWNIEKAQHKKLRKELTDLAGKADFLVLQEAVNQPWLHKLKPYSLFAPGYATSRIDTGVLLLGDHPVLFSCLFKHKEPWLRSPKASAITVIPISNKQHVVIANIHAINFTLGIEKYKSQLKNLFGALKNYSGPLIVAGDFNTWNKARADWLMNETTALRLQQVTFDKDARSKVFGRFLDHIFYRDIQLSTSTTQYTNSSDHNPLIITMQVNRKNN